MGLRIFIIGAIVLAAFAVVASAASNGACLGVSYSSWLIASLLSFFVDVLTGGYAWTVGTPRQQPPPQ